MDTIQALILGMIAGWIAGVSTRLAADRRDKSRSRKAVTRRYRLSVEGMPTQEKVTEQVVVLDSGDLMHCELQQN